MLEIIQTPEAAQSFALIRRHRCGITTISTWPTRNSAHDALYDELNAIIVPRRSRRLERAVTMGGTVAAILTLAVVALSGLLWFSISDTASAFGAPYTVTLDR